MRSSLGCTRNSASLHGKSRPVPTRTNDNPATGREPRYGCLYFTSCVLDRSCLADLVAAVPAFRAPLRPSVDGAQVLQHELQIGSFTHGDNMINLAAVHAARDRVVTDPADGAVRLVHQTAQLLPPVPATAHRAASSRFNRHINMIGA